MYIIYGSDAQALAYRLMQEMNIAEKLAALGRKPLIGIKPNLVVSQPASWGATTEPGLVRGVLQYLQEHGFDNILILESSWVGDQTSEAFEVCGYRDIEREFGVPLFDLKKDKSVWCRIDDVEIEVCAKVFEIDYLINMPVLKAHCQTKITCALKNIKGCIPDREKKRFHELGLHRPIALLNKIVKQNLIIVDGIIGDLTYEGGGTPVRMDRVLAGFDPVKMDAYAAELIGYNLDEIPYIGMAERLGVGTSEYNSVVELNDRQEVGIDVKLASRELEELEPWIDEQGACSACYGSLVHALKRMKEKGKLEQLPKVAIGQGWQDQSGKLGVGSCTRQFDCHVKGCPPSAGNMVKMFERWLERQK